MLGCDSESFGFASDFGVQFTSRGAETTWHVDCAPPRTPDSTCSVFRVFLVPVPVGMPCTSLTRGGLPVDLNAVHFPDAVQEAWPESEPDGNATARRLAIVSNFTIGTWPPRDATRVTPSAADCPNLELGNIPRGVGKDIPAVGSEDTSPAAWTTAILAALPVTPTATVAQQASQACMSSMLCMAGYSAGSKLIFGKQFWASASAMSVSMNTAIANQFQGAMTTSNMKKAFTSLGGRTSITCTNYYSYALCGPGTVPVTAGVCGTGTCAAATYTCKAWNTRDVRAGAIERVPIGVVLGHRRHAVEPAVAGAPLPPWHDDARVAYTQDYCGAVGLGSRADNSSTYYAGAGFDSRYMQTPTGGSYAFHPVCWGGRPIPLCRSFNMITYSEC